MIWKRLFSRRRLKGIKVGYAYLEKDEISGKKYWVTWDAEGEDRFALDPGLPLVLPPSDLPLGTYVEIYQRKKK